MSISIELKPEVEERLSREASSRGVSVEAYVEEIIERQVAQPRATAAGVAPDELERLLDTLSEGSDSRPVLPPDAYTRQSIYREHD